MMAVISLSSMDVVIWKGVLHYLLALEVLSRTVRHRVFPEIYLISFYVSRCILMMLCSSCFVFQTTGDQRVPEEKAGSHFVWKCFIKHVVPFSL